MRLIRVLSLALLGSAPLLSCQKKAEREEAPRPTTETDAAEWVEVDDLTGALEASSRKVEPPACQLVAGGGSTFGATAEQPSNEDVVDVPFGAELGQGIPYLGGFVVAALLSNGRDYEARLIWLSADAKDSTEVSLGTVHGDAPPPEVAVVGQEVLVAISDMDASGRTLRTAYVADVSSKPIVRFGPEVQAGADGSSAFALAALHDRALLVWDDVERSPKIGPRGVINGLLLTPKSAAADIGKLETGHSRGGQAAIIRFSPPTVDAEAPQIVSRGDALWLTWLVRRTGADSEDGAVEEQWLQAVLLDIEAHQLGAPVDIHSPKRQVQSYQRAVDASGALNLLFVDELGPGSPHDSVEFARVLPDGSVHKKSWRVFSTAGTPALLQDGAARQPALWVLLADDAGDLQLADVSVGDTAPVFRQEPALARSRPVAMNQGRLLLAQPAGRGLRFKAADCVAPASVSPPPTQPLAAPSKPAPPKEEKAQ